MTTNSLQGVKGGFWLLCYQIGTKIRLDPKKIPWEDLSLFRISPSLRPPSQFTMIENWTSCDLKVRKVSAQRPYNLCGCDVAVFKWTAVFTHTTGPACISLTHEWLDDFPRCIPLVWWKNTPVHGRQVHICAPAKDRIERQLLCWMTA